MGKRDELERKGRKRIQKNTRHYILPFANPTPKWSLALKLRKGTTAIKNLKTTGKQPLP